MKQSKDNRFIPMTSVSSNKGFLARPDVYYYTNQIVNVVMIGKPGSANWVMVDAGMPKCGDELINVAEERFGKGVAPAAVILTHGHFDHVGGIIEMIKHWKMPVYAHPLEFPYLTGVSAYPEPDRSVDGGVLARISSIYPYHPIDITEALLAVPEDHSLPGLTGWRWIHVPGHSPGQIALFRESDRTLLSADAFVTVRQDLLYNVLVQKKEVCGPPRYFTTDWPAARPSVQELQALQPALVVSGHGICMEGEELRTGLQRLAGQFEELAVPKYGKYVH